MPLALPTSARRKAKDLMDVGDIAVHYGESVAGLQNSIDASQFPAALLAINSEHSNTSFVLGVNAPMSAWLAGKRDASGAPAKVRDVATIIDETHFKQLMSMVNVKRRSAQVVRSAPFLFARVDDGLFLLLVDDKEEPHDAQPTEQGCNSRPADMDGAESSSDEVEWSPAPNAAAAAADASENASGGGASSGAHSTETTHTSSLSSSGKEKKTQVSLTADGKRQRKRKSKKDKSKSNGVANSGNGTNMERATSSRHSQEFERVGGLLQVDVTTRMTTFAARDIVKLERLAQGPTSTVYRCSINGGQFCLKSIDAALLQPDEVTAIKHSVCVAEALDEHPNVLRYCGHNFQMHDGALLVITELLDGTYRAQLDARFVERAQPKWNDEELTLHLLQIARALRFLHAQAIIHRDVKADNVFCQQQLGKLTLKLGDFDECIKQASDLDEADLKVANVGTPAWMAPEVAQAHHNDSAAYGTAADIFSFGIVVFEVLWPHDTPYAGISRFDLPKHVQEGHRPRFPAKARQTGLRKQLYNVHLDCTEVDPAARPTAADLVRMLDTLERDKVKH